MKQYRLVDNIFGWVAFVIAAFVYCSTIEPTASFWDCPEFITTAYKQEIGHPPGAPFFMLLGNFFTHFASDATQVAKMVNTMSALLSAVCILFLFWTITHLARKLIISDWKEMTTSKLIAIEASGMVGALIYTFSCSILADTEVGRPCRRTSQRSLACTHRLYDRSEYRCAPAQPALYPGHRTRILL